MSFYVYLIRNSCCSDSTLISSAINTEKFTFSAGVLLKFQVFWNVALSPLASSLRHFECRRVFLFRVQESRSNFIRHGSSKLIILKFFGNTWQVNQVIEMSLHIQEISVKENNSRIGLNQCFESNFNTWSHHVKFPIPYICFGVCTMFVFKKEYSQPQLVNPLKTNRRLLYLKTQFVPRSKHISSQL